MERISVQEAGLVDLPRIRGHHLENLLQLYIRAREEGLQLSYCGYPELPQDVRSLLQKSVNNVARGVRSMSGFSVYTHPDEYYLDILGGNEKEEEGYKQRLYEALAEIVSSPPDQQVLLTQTPDRICRACKTGKHCLRMGAATPNPNLDLGIIDTYCAGLISLDIHYEEYYEKFVYSNIGVEIAVKAVLTTIGGLRSCLSLALEKCM